MPDCENRRKVIYVAYRWHYAILYRRQDPGRRWGEEAPHNWLLTMHRVRTYDSSANGLWKEQIIIQCDIWLASPNTLLVCEFLENTDIALRPRIGDKLQATAEAKKGIETGVEPTVTKEVLRNCHNDQNRLRSRSGFKRKWIRQKPVTMISKNCLLTRRDFPRYPPTESDEGSYGSYGFARWARGIPRSLLLGIRAVLYTPMSPESAPHSAWIMVLGLKLHWLASWGHPLWAQFRAMLRFRLGLIIPLKRRMMS